MASNHSSTSPLFVAAGKPPAGLSPSELNSSYNGVLMTSILGVFATIAVICYGLRIHAKCLSARKLGWDDFCCTLALIGALLNILCFAIASIDSPLGKHIWNVTLMDILSSKFVVTGFLIQVTASLTLGLIKLTIFLFYLGIFWPLEWCRWAIYIGASISSTFYLSMTIAQFYFESPRPGETLAKHVAGKLAAKATHISIPTTSVGLSIDILLLIIPLLAVVQLRMAKKKKIQLLFTFFVGIIAIAGSIISLSFKIKTYGNPDITYHLILVNFFVDIEMIFGIYIACVPLIPRVATHHQKRFNAITSLLSSSLFNLGKTIHTRITSQPKSTFTPRDIDSGSNSNLVELRKVHIVHSKDFISTLPEELV